MLRKIRITLATVFLVGITLLFLDYTFTVQPVLGWMAKLQFLPGVMAMNLFTIVGVLLLTLIMGRIYCSVICPLGVMQDVFAWIGKRRLFRKGKSKTANRYSYSKPKTWLRLTVLVLYAVMLVAGVNSVFVLLAPYSAYGRIVSAFLQPLYININNVLGNIEGADSYTFYPIDPQDTPAMLAIVAGITAVVLMVLAFRNGRTYCNTICPVGTLLGYVSRFSFLKMFVDEDKCTKCGLCMKNCKASCISVEKGKPVSIDHTRCVDCGNCQTLCPKSAIAFGRQKKTDTTPSNPETATNNPEIATGEAKADEISRRSFIGIMGLATAATLKAQEKTTDGGLAVIKDKQVPDRKTPLTPPGSFSARNLQQHCTGCQLCVTNCPNNVLRPNTSLSNFMQPVMEYENGYCSPSCTQCSAVCPTGAIKPITVEEKTAIQIGHAVWVKKNCVPLTDGVTCGNCARHCPSGAIKMVPIDKSLTQDEDDKWHQPNGDRVDERELLMIPVINTEKCIGCGACENLCPSRPFSAIYVEGHEVHREI